MTDTLSTRTIRFGFSRLQALAFIDAMTRKAEKRSRPFTAEDVRCYAVELDAAERFFAALRAEPESGVGEIVAVVEMPVVEHEAVLLGDAGKESWVGGNELVHWAFVQRGVLRVVEAVRRAIEA